MIKKWPRFAIAKASIWYFENQLVSIEGQKMRIRGHRFGVFSHSSLKAVEKRLTQAKAWC